MSIFSALPWALKSTLRANPSVDAIESPAASNHPPNPADLLPTQPPSEDGGGGEETGASPPIAAASGSGQMPTLACAAGSAATQKRAGEPLALPSKHRRADAKLEIETENDETEPHPWDCTGLVPRFECAKDVPAHLKKCTC